MNKKLGRLPSNNRTRKLPTPIAFSFFTPTPIRTQFPHIYQAMENRLQIRLQTSIKSRVKQNRLENFRRVWGLEHGGEGKKKQPTKEWSAA
jgi:hypothetical protein